MRLLNFCHWWKEIRPVWRYVLFKFRKHTFFIQFSNININMIQIYVNHLGVTEAWKKVIGFMFLMYIIWFHIKVVDWPFIPYCLKMLITFAKSTRLHIPLFWSIILWWYITEILTSFRVYLFFIKWNTNFLYLFASLFSFWVNRIFDFEIKPINDRRQKIKVKNRFKAGVQPEILKLFLKIVSSVSLESYCKPSPATV